MVFNKKKFVYTKTVLLTLIASAKGIRKERYTIRVCEKEGNLEGGRIGIWELGYLAVNRGRK